MSKKTEGETPLIRQFNKMKAKYPDAILLFRVGDFYETFGQDAIDASKILGITLTRRANGKNPDLELAGFPHHAIDTYLPKLIMAGRRCAICEQLEDPKLAKGIVKRGIVEVVTPSLSYNDKTSDHSRNNFLASIHFGKKNIGIALLDIGTGEFYLSEGNKTEIDKLITSLSPKEFVIERKNLRLFQESFGKEHFINSFDDWVFSFDYANELLLKHFGTNSLKGFGIEDDNLGIIAAGASIHYLNDTKHSEISHVQKISNLNNNNYLWLDGFTIKNLEILSPSHEKGSSLYDIINRTKSNMGARRLQRWMVMPLLEIEEIEKRQNIVELFLNKEELSHRVGENIRTIGDLERIVAKLAYKRIQPNELIGLKNILIEANKLRENIEDEEAIRDYYKKIADFAGLVEKIESMIKEDAPNNVSKQGVIMDGVSEELDNVRDLLHNGKTYLKNIHKREIENTQIPSLRLGFNNVFGYYLEVTNTHKDKVPEEWIRKQTLTNSERYITEELKEYETKILGAEQRILELETSLYAGFVEELQVYISEIQKAAEAVSELDALYSFAEIAIENNYIRPRINSGKSIKIVDGRHPVIEKLLPMGEKYVANNLLLDPKTRQISIITGPNMSGKSAYLRQNALIILMAQMGSYVPAKSADIGIVDRIFTRVGASDNISSGESTFMVEMNEAASILNNLTDRSFVLLDEIGRGTSTYDGVSIAWSIASYIHNNRQARAKVLFATHYHELIELEKTYPRIHNLHVSVEERGKEIIFLRKIASGGSSQSFGIHVARLAGMPNSLIEEAEEILSSLEKNKNKEDISMVAEPKTEKESYQLSFIQLDDPILLEIKEDILSTDIDNLTPVEALMKLNSIKEIIEKV